MIYEDSAKALHMSHFKSGLQWNGQWIKSKSTIRNTNTPSSESYRKYFVCFIYIHHWYWIVLVVY